MMKAKKIVGILMIVLVLVTVVGCGGAKLNRITGLAPDAVVKTFFNAAKNGKLNEAGLYVSPTSKSDIKTVLKYVTGTGIDEIKNANLLSVKLVLEQGNYASVVATLQQQQDSLKITVKPIGLERIDGEWYIVDFDQIYRNAKYQVLAKLLENI